MNSGPIDLRPAFLEVKALIAKATEANFQGSHDPEGNRWLDITDFTLAHRLQDVGGGKPLLDTDTLHQEAVKPTETLTESSMTLRVETPYAGKHQFGGWSESRRRVPQRKFIGWNQEMIAETKKIIAAHAASTLRSRAA